MSQYQSDGLHEQRAIMKRYLEDAKPLTGESYLFQHKPDYVLRLLAGSIPQLERDPTKIIPSLYQKSTPDIKLQTPQPRPLYVPLDQLQKYGDSLDPLYH